MLDKLSSLAHESSSEKRRELMDEITDIFVAGSKTYTDRELFLFGEVLTDLLNSVDGPSQARLSATIAHVRQTPRNLAVSLVKQEIAVAGPILEHSPVLTDEDILEIANTSATDHRLAISKRVGLTASVSDVLIEYGEEPVLHSVCRNKSAEISARGFNTLADFAENDSELRDGLSHRSDMPEEIVQRVLPILSAEAQKRLKDLVVSQGLSVVTGLVEDARQQSQELVQDNQRQRAEIRILLVQIKSKKLDLGSVVEQFCHEDRLLDVGFLLASISNLPENQATNALTNPDYRAIVVLCRALDLSEKSFSAVAKLRCRRLDLNDSDEEHLNKNFASFDRSAAQRALRYLKGQNAR